MPGAGVRAADPVALWHPSRDASVVVKATRSSPDAPHRRQVRETPAIPTGKRDVTGARREDGLSGGVGLPERPHHQACGGLFLPDASGLAAPAACGSPLMRSGRPALPGSRHRSRAFAAEPLTRSVADGALGDDRRPRRTDAGRIRPTATGCTAPGPAAGSQRRVRPGRSAARVQLSEVTAMSARWPPRRARQRGTPSCCSTLWTSGNVTPRDAGRRHPVLHRPSGRRARGAVEVVDAARAGIAAGRSRCIRCRILPARRCRPACTRPSAP